MKTLLLIAGALIAGAFYAREVKTATALAIVKAEEARQLAAPHVTKALNEAKRVR